MTNPESRPPHAEETEDYCRQLEAYLCRKNDGHLIRVVGPAFEQVCGWAARGIPLKMAMRGIDRYFERYYAKGPRRRPVRIEFCEADVLDIFDEWRRSVGISAATNVPEETAAENDGVAAQRGTGSTVSLPGHLERVIARLTALRGSQDRSLDSTIDDLVRELDAARARSKSIRGDAREALLDRLRELDAALMDAVRSRADAQTLEQFAVEADEELRPFRGRMPADAYQQSRRACVDRLLREKARVPNVAFE